MDKVVFDGMVHLIHEGQGWVQIRTANGVKYWSCDMTDFPWLDTLPPTVSNVVIYRPMVEGYVNPDTGEIVAS